MGCNVQRKIKTARRALKAAMRSLTRSWTELVLRLHSAVRGRRLSESETDSRTATSEREAA